MFPDHILKYMLRRTTKVFILIIIGIFFSPVKIMLTYLFNSIKNF